jgi:capsular exopolysaccharide synthesis family protein
MNHPPDQLPEHRAIVPATAQSPLPQVAGAVPTNPAVAPASSLNVIDLLRALRRRWAMATFLGMACAAVVGGTTWYIIPPAQYTARALLHVAAIPPRVIFPTAESRTDYGTFQRTQVTMIKSRHVLNTAFRRDEIKNLPIVRNQVDPVEWLEREVKVNFPGGSEILEIAMNGDSPQILAAVVNAVTNAYLTEVVDVEHNDRLRRHDMLKKIWGDYQSSLQKKRDELRKLAEAVGSDNKQTLSLKQQFELERHSRVENDLMQVQSELRKAQIELEVRQSREEEVVITAADVEGRIASDPGVELRRSQIADLETKIRKNSRLTQKKSDPSVRMFQFELEAARKSLNEYQKRLRPIVVKELQEQLRNSPSSLEPLQEQIELLTKLEGRLKAEFDSLKENERQLNRGVLDVGSIQEEIEQAEVAAKTVGTEVEALKVELQAPPRIRLFEKAENPRRKDDGKKARMAGIASAGAFAFVLLGISFWEYRSRRIDSIEEVMHILGMRVVGALPSIPKPARQRRDLALAAPDRASCWFGQLIESVDAARTMVLHAARLNEYRILMVTSANVGEAKTSFSGHLATSLARSGRVTLLIDFDLRRPTAHRICGVPLEPGLSEFLRGEIDIAAAIRPTMVGGLWILPAGKSDSRTIIALAQVNLRSVFESLKDQFDFLIIDSSPVLPVADSLLIGQHVDAVIFSILREVSRRPEVATAKELLAALQIPILGAVVSRARGPVFYRSQYGDRYINDTDDQNAKKLNAG